jgi:2-polyprenyl-6-methoxyphenol hydroxylase-like FAD-dependent oxidoreductase
VTLGWLLDQFERAPDWLFDSAEQVHIDRWHTDRVVLVGDAAWCLTLYSGMGVSAALAGADLLGTMLERHPRDLAGALRAWEDQLRPFIRYHVGAGINQRRFFTPADRKEFLIQSVIMRLIRVPVVGKRFARVLMSGKDAGMKGWDIAAAPL